MKTKEQLIDRWGVIFEDIENGIPTLQERYNNPERNYRGDFTGVLAMEYSGLAGLRYLLYNDAKEFKSNLEIASKYVIELFERFEKGDPIDPSRVSMFRFIELLEALASGNINIATKFANHMGGRPKIEGQYDDDFMLSMGYVLKYSVENNKSKVAEWIVKLKEVCANKRYRDFLGYPLVLEALLENNLSKANDAFKVLIAGHKNKCKSNRGPDYGPYFHDSPDEDLFVWGIGLANLCRYYGLDVTIDDPIMPAELIVPVNNSQPKDVFKPTSKYEKLKFQTYWDGFAIGDLNYVVRFAVPDDWSVDEKNSNELGNTILTPNGKDFNSTDAFIAVHIYEQMQDSGSLEEKLEAVEKSFMEDGWVKDQELSKLSTYDKRLFSTLFLRNEEIEYARKMMILPLKESPYILLDVAFQVSHLEQEYLDKYFPIFEDIIRSFKLREEEIDTKERDEYTRQLASSDEFIKNIGK